MFHHAVSQTAPPPPPRPHEPRPSRETQTRRTAAHGSQTPREAALQMPRRGLVLDASHDRAVAAGAPTQTPCRLCSNGSVVLLLCWLAGLALYSHGRAAWYC